MTDNCSLSLFTDRTVLFITKVTHILHKTEHGLPMLYIWYIYGITTPFKHKVNQKVKTKYYKQEDNMNKPKMCHFEIFQVE